jgi:hypothetical protein
MVARADRSLLPGAPHASAARAPIGIHAIDIAASRAFNLDPQTLIDMTDPDTCPAAALPFLAWAASVDEWPVGATADQKRAIIKASVAVHRSKGTMQSIKAVLEAAGYGAATITLGADIARYSGGVNYDGSISYGSENNWALWSITIENSDPIPSDYLINLLIRTAPARCVLVSVGYQKLFFRHNAVFTHDGTRNYQPTYTEAA